MAKTLKAPVRLRLTRPDMEKTIKDGGAVMYGGEIISKVEDLPTDVDLAIGDPDAESAQDSLIERQIEALRQEKTRLAQARAQRAQQRQAAQAAAAEGEEDADKPARGRKGVRKAAGTRKPGRKARAEKGQEQTSEAAGGTEEAAGSDDGGNVDGAE